MSDVSIIVVSRDALAAFARPAIDLRTGEIVELPAEVEPVQLEIPFDVPGATDPPGG